MKKFLFLIVIAAFTVGCGKSKVNTINTCKSCHTDTRMLKIADPGIISSDFLVTSGFLNSPHNVLQCVDCHKGDPSNSSMQRAHEGIISDPSKNPDNVCAHCHSAIVQNYKTSLHYTLAGEQSYLQKISYPYYDDLNTPNKAECQNCHASCGSCHVQKPLSGGLISGHTFMKIPPMQDTCVQCHKEQATEFMGLSGQAPDIHYIKGMQCIDCHKNGIHGDGTNYTTMWQVKEMPRCGSCHTDVTGFTSTVHEHDIPQHISYLSCTVCHAQPYTNTFNYKSMFVGNRYIGAAGITVTDFKIGLNTITTESYLYATVRHYPITRDTFDYFGAGLLPGFDLVPTWRTTYPHNIRLITAQNGGDSSKSCSNCHSNPDLFLTRNDLNPYDSAANLTVTVTQPPPAVVCKMCH